MPKPPPVEETLAEAIEQLVLERINGYGASESDAVQAAYGGIINGYYWS